LNNNERQEQKCSHRLAACQQLRVGSKESIQQGHSQFQARSVLPVREHRKVATCLLEAAPAKAANTAGGFFQQTPSQKP